MPSETPSASTLLEMSGMCEGYYIKLIEGGCAEDVAADRTFDALQAAFGEVPQCFDRRDRLFESKLRAVAERGKDA